MLKKKYGIYINADLLAKCPKIGITVGSLLNKEDEHANKKKRHTGSFLYKASFNPQWANV